jgi:hypothetical protein
MSPDAAGGVAILDCKLLTLEIHFHETIAFTHWLLAPVVDWIDMLPFTSFSTNNARSTSSID